MAVTFVQGAIHGILTAATSTATSFTGVPVAGHLLVAYGMYFGVTTAATTSVSDGGGGVWVKVLDNFANDSARNISLWYCLSATTNQTVTFAATGGTGTMSQMVLMISEYSGVTGTALTGSSSARQGSVAGSVGAGTFVYAACSYTGTLTFGTGFTAANNALSANSNIWSDEFSTTTVTPGYTTSGTMLTSAAFGLGSAGVPNSLSLMGSGI